MSEYRVVVKAGEGYTEEKRSKFIGNLRAVASEEEALAFVKEMKKKYYDARHNCYAYVIGDNNEIQHASDDGEPSGTAGRPMLDVLLGENIHNACIVVTRYFGGTLLGTGGLVRNYQGSTKDAIANSEIRVMKLAQKIAVKVDYNSVGKLKYIMEQMGLDEESSEYGADVTVNLIIVPEKYDDFVAKVTESTGGKAIIEVTDEGFYPC